MKGNNANAKVFLGANNIDDFSSGQEKKKVFECTKTDELCNIDIKGDTSIVETLKGSNEEERKNDF